MNNNSVETGADALGISKLVATTDDTSLLLSKPKTIFDSIDFDLKYFEPGNHAIRRVDSSNVTIVGADKPEKLEVELNNNAVETGADALGISKFAATPDDTSLSSSHPVSTAYIFKIVAHGSYQPYKWAMPYKWAVPSNIPKGLSLDSNNDFHGTPEMTEVEFIDMKPFEGINNPVGAGARDLGITSYVGRYGCVQFI